MPVRTKFGYHILKVTDIRDAQGQVHAAHIMVRTPENANDSAIALARKKADEIYMKVKNGEDFATLAANYSDDRTSGKNGGQLPWFGTGKMVPEFEKAAFELKENDQVTEPIRTQYGFHIIKRLDRKGVQPFDEVKSDLKQKISKDSRSQVSRNAVLERIKKESNFTEDAKALNELIAKIDTSYLNGNWSTDKVAAMNKPLFRLGTEVTTQADFARFLAENQSRQLKGTSMESLVRKTYDAFKDDRIIAYEDARLESKYPEFRMLMQEYRDGILLFEITDENVWTKAIRDSAGLADFQKKNSSKYMWGERTEAVVYKAKDEKTAKAVRKLVSKGMKKGVSVEDIEKKINESSQLNLQTEQGKFSKGDNEAVDRNPWVAGVSPDYKAADGSVTFVHYKTIIEPQPKSLSEARGMITADYQNYLEQEWIKSLRAKYAVDVNREVFNTIN
jgi:peptidyl-prolyl cis-trans isomerase SurA